MAGAEDDPAPPGEDVVVDAPTTAAGAQRFEQRFTRACWGFVALGIVLRLVELARNRSLWLDEAMLALSIVRRGFGGLLQPLVEDQVAPIGFLWLTEALTRVLGLSDVVLRLLPCCAGCLALVAFGRLAPRILKPGAALTAILLFALLDPLIYYSAEFKAYALDLATSTALLLFAIEQAEQPLSSRRVVLWGLAGALVLSLSHGAAFVLGGVWIFLALTKLRQSPGAWHALALLALAWGAALAALYFGQVRGATDNPHALLYWQQHRGFLPWPPSQQTLTWLAHRWVASLVSSPLSLTHWVLPTLLVGAGAVRLARKRHQLLILLAAPALVGLVASALRLYPFHGRLLLFLVPMALLLCGKGIELVARLKPPWNGLAMAACAMALLAGPFQQLATQLRQGRQLQDVKGVLEYLAHHRQGEPILVHFYAAPAVEFYAPRYGLARRGHDREGGLEAEGWSVPVRKEPAFREETDPFLAELAGRAVWIVSVDVDPVAPKVSSAAFRQYFEERGAHLRGMHQAGAAAHLYRLPRRDD